MITKRFVSTLACQNPDCGEAAFVSGSISVHEGMEEDGPFYFELRRPLAIVPPAAVFQLDDRWPEAVRNELRLSFSHIWADPGAAANRLRTAVECLMDDRGVKKFPRTGPRTKINLHTRIADYQRENADAAELLLAVKWLGNSGSHADDCGLTREDVLDGMELLERAMHLIYDDTPQRLAKLARRINRRRGPARARQMA